MAQNDLNDLRTMEGLGGLGNMAMPSVKWMGGDGFELMFPSGSFRRFLPPRNACRAGEDKKTETKIRSLVKIPHKTNLIFFKIDEQLFYT